jgi:hypothetical protein
MLRVPARACALRSRAALPRRARTAPAPCSAAKRSAPPDTQQARAVLQCASKRAAISAHVRSRPLQRSQLVTSPGSKTRRAHGASATPQRGPCAHTCRGVRALTPPCADAGGPSRGGQAWCRHAQTRPSDLAGRCYARARQARAAEQRRRGRRVGEKRRDGSGDATRCCACAINESARCGRHGHAAARSAACGCCCCSHAAAPLAQRECIFCGRCPSWRCS